jgi:hypothetical protein
VTPRATRGIDVGTASTTGVLVDFAGGAIRPPTHPFHTSTTVTVHALAAREQRTSTTPEEPR